MKSKKGRGRGRRRMERGWRRRGSDAGERDSDLVAERAGPRAGQSYQRVSAASLGGVDHGAVLYGKETI